ncbi:MAG: hypothetical protein ACR2JS_03070 [Candidatus Nanopelagicales bacterium]
MTDADLGDEYERELARVVERTRTMPLTRLSTCSDDVFALCCTLADLAQESGSGLAGARAVPRLGDHALPDQLHVLGMELVAVADPAVLARAHSLLVDMRKALP